MSNTEISMIATTIHAQVGPRAFAMMGAKNLLAGDRSLQWKVGGNAKKVTHVTVLLAADDTYTVTFHRVTKRGLNVKVIAELEGVYVDSLHRVIESATGFYLSL